MKKNIISKLILLVGFVIGVGILLYPLFSQLFYDFSIKNNIELFQKELENFSPQELKDKRLELAEAFNEALEPDLIWEDPYSEDKRNEGVKEYAKMLEVQEKIGLVNIPKISVLLPIYAGTGDRILRKGAGHLEGSSLPIGGKNTHSVITSHNGLPEARLFTDLKQLDIGDTFSVETLAGEIFYQVDNISVVEPTDIGSMRIVEGEDYITLLTCTPYMINSHRLLVRGTRIQPPEEYFEGISLLDQIIHYLRVYWYYILLILLMLLLVIFVLKKSTKKIASSR